MRVLSLGLVFAFVVATTAGAQVPNNGVTITPDAPNTPNANDEQLEQPAVTVEPKPILTPIRDLVSAWGYEIVGCGNDTAAIRYGDSSVCVKPSEKLPPGNYVYEPCKNAIVPQQLKGNYTFTNVLEYSNCLEDIIKLYENKGLSATQSRKSSCREDLFSQYKETGIPKDQAAMAIQEADFYATALLNTKLYPPRGQRLRVAKLFGYIYQIDR